jgi:hypothetical protein
MHYKTAWDDYFPGTNSPNLNSQTYNSRQTPSGTNVYVLNCLFKSITSADVGGALSCSSATYFLVESTSFFSCKTSSNRGGAIYFCDIGSGQSVLHEVCGYNCSSNPFQQFAYLHTSISRCVNGFEEELYQLFINFTLCKRELELRIPYGS